MMNHFLLTWKQLHFPGNIERPPIEKPARGASVCCSTTNRSRISSLQFFCVLFSFEGILMRIFLNSTFIGGPWCI